MMLTTNYVKTKPLLSFLCQAMADNIKDMKVEDEKSARLQERTAIVGEMAVARGVRAVAGVA